MHATTAQETALEVIRATMDSAFTAQVEALLETGEYRFVYDPQVDGVIGLLRNGAGNTAVAVVYVNDEDCEFNEEFFA